MQKLELIRQEIGFLLSDFQGFGFDPKGFLLKVLYFLFVLILFLVMYMLGRIVIRKWFNFVNIPILEPFVKLAIGYILLGTFVFGLGFLGVLTNFSVYTLIVVLGVVSFVDLVRNPVKFKLPKLKIGKDYYKILGIIIIAIYFLRLLPPPVNGDGIDYHISFPRIYLYERTLMIPPLGDESYTTVPHLPEMLFIISEVVSHGEMSRIIHFGFFIVVFLLLYNFNPLTARYQRVGPISALIFATAPLILHIGTSSFSDYPAIFCLMLSGYLLLTPELSKRQVVLAGFLMGGALASKIWVFVVFPVYVLYMIVVSRRKGFPEAVGYAALFVVVSMLVPLVWLIRSYLLTGNIFYINENLGKNNAKLSLIKYILSPFNSNYLMNRFGSVFDYGVLYMLGLGLFAFKARKAFKELNVNFLILTFLLIAAAFFLPFSFSSGRYALPYMIPLFLISAAGFAMFTKNKALSFLLFASIFSMCLYYAFNTILQVPYGFAWASQENYIKRNLVRDPVSYYDFNGTFRSEISTGEVVVTYGIRGYSYANFIHRNIYYFIDQKSSSFILRGSGISKILIRGGDFNWMCARENLSNCNEYQLSLITGDDIAKQFLYSISYKDEH